MALEQERSKPLHNFNLPCLKWGNQRFLRCMKVNSIAGDSVAGRRSSASEADGGMIGRRKESAVAMRGSATRTKSFERSPPATVGGAGRKSKRGREGDDGIDAFMAKLMSDLQTATNRMTFAILEERLKGESSTAAAAPAEAVRPWNLRKRRATCKAPNGVGGGGKSTPVDDRRPNCSPSATESRTLRLRGAETAAASIEKQERAKFSVSLSRQEIEEDFMKMVGRRPLRRPRKRARNVQKRLDNLFPGLWLPEVTADRYQVPDTEKVIPQA